MTGFRIDQTINDDGTYTLNRTFTYYSPRYNKNVTCSEGMNSDGATDVVDIDSRSWWVHDRLCDTGVWDDGTKVTNWQASQVLADVLTEEGRSFRAKTWQIGTFLFGGGKARENGMFCLKGAK